MSHEGIKSILEPFGTQHACNRSNSIHVLRKYLNSIKIVQFAPQIIIDTSYVKWRDNENFCSKTQIK